MLCSLQTGKLCSHGSKLSNVTKVHKLLGFQENNCTFVTAISKSYDGQEYFQTGNERGAAYQEAGDRDGES